MCIEAEVLKVSSPGSPSPSSAVLSDNTAEIKAIWFNPYIAKILRPGCRAAFYGKAEYSEYNNAVQLVNPEFEVLYKDKKAKLFRFILLQAR